MEQLCHNYIYAHTRRLLPNNTNKGTHFLQHYKENGMFYMHPMFL